MGLELGPPVAPAAPAYRLAGWRENERAYLEHVRQRPDGLSESAGWSCRFGLSMRGTASTDRRAAEALTVIRDSPEIRYALTHAVTCPGHGPLAATSEQPIYQ
jgi:hypothetical protein